MRFEQYDLPEVKTEDGISTTGDLQEAWFRDPDGNILRIHSHVDDIATGLKKTAITRWRPPDSGACPLRPVGQCARDPNGRSRTVSPSADLGITRS